MNLIDLISNYTCKHKNKIKKVVAPLTQISGITGFFHYTLDKSGKFTYLSNTPDWAEEYFAESLFISNPYLRHPELLKSGAHFTRTIKDEKYQDTLDRRKSKFEVDHSMLLIESVSTGVEVSGFFTDSANTGIYNFYFNEMPLIKKYIEYFKHEMSPELNSMNRNAGDMRAAKRGKFLEPDKQPIGISPKDRLDFYKKINITTPLMEKVPFSPRERDLIPLIKMGKSANEMAKILFLSPRTVEAYLATLKGKLMCSKKSDLIHRLNELEVLGL